MSFSLREVLIQAQVKDEDLALWIAESWVLPRRDEGQLSFDEADLARIRLIAELRHDLGVNEEAIPVVLRLLDQVHGLRHRLSRLEDAIAQLPVAIRQDLQELLEEEEV